MTGGRRPACLDHAAGGEGVRHPAGDVGWDGRQLVVQVICQNTRQRGQRGWIPVVVCAASGLSYHVVLPVQRGSNGISVSSAVLPHAPGVTL